MMYQYPGHINHAHKFQPNQPQIPHALSHAIQVLCQAFDTDSPARNTSAVRDHHFRNPAFPLSFSTLNRSMIHYLPSTVLAGPVQVL